MCVIAMNLEGEKNEESHHQTKETHSLWQGEAKDSIWEELLFQWGVAGVSNNEAAKHAANTSSCKSQGKTMSNEDPILITGPNLFFTNEVYLLLKAFLINLLGI